MTVVSEHSTVPMVAGEARLLGVWVGVRRRNRFPVECSCARHRLTINDREVAFGLVIERIL